MSAVPAAVQQQLDRANALEEQTRDTPPPPPQEVPEQALAPASGISDDGGWQQRYQSLQGKYNAEVPRMQAENRRLQQEMDAVRSEGGRTTDELRQLKEQMQSARADTALAKLDEDYDPEGVVAVLKTLKDENAALRAQMSAMTGDVSTLKNVEESRSQNVSELLADEVRKAVPTLDAINQDPAFQQWVNDVDETVLMATGERRTRQNIFDEIVNSVRIETLPVATRRAVTLYQQWERDKGVQTPAASISPSDTANTTQQGSQGELWGPAKVKQFYADQRRGVFKGREEEAARLDRSLTRAGNEGRWDPRL